MLWFDFLLSLIVVIGDHVYFPQFICRRIQYLALAYHMIGLNPFIYIFFVIYTWYKSIGNQYSGEEIEFVLNSI